MLDCQLLLSISLQVSRIFFFYSPKIAHFPFFFQDQPFWGSIIKKNEVGGPPIPYSDISVDRLVASWRICLQSQPRFNTFRLSGKLKNEDTRTKAVQLFHKYLPLDSEGNLIQTTYQSERWYPMLGWKRRFTGCDWGDKRGVISFPMSRFPLKKEWSVVRDWTGVPEENLPGN